MKIVILGYNDVCGILSNLKVAINKYTTHNAILGVKEGEYYFKDTGGIDFNLNDKPALQDAMSDCDVIHWSDIQPKKNRKYYKLPSVGVEVVHVHGTSIRREPGLYAPEKYPVLYSTPDLAGFINNKHKMWLPNPLREGLPDMIGGQTEPIMCHTPTPCTNIENYLSSIPLTEEQGLRHGYTGNPGYLLKHSDFFMETCQNQGFPFKLLGRVSNKRCIDEMRACPILFDNIFFGSYGVSAIESLAMGMNVMSRISSITQSHLDDITDLRCPIYDTREKHFIQPYKQILRDVDWHNPNPYNQAWVRAVHGLPSVAKRYIDFLKECY